MTFRNWIRQWPLALAALSLSGCAQNSLLDRSLVFSTHTTAGVELSVQPADAGGSPVSMVIGYKRFEGVLNPVFYNHQAEKVRQPLTSENVPKDVSAYYLPRAYSVLAKVGGGANAAAGSTGSIAGSLSQWFATGTAAEILAAQPGIAAAITGLSEVKATQVQSTDIDISKQPPRLAAPLVANLYTQISLDAAEGKAEAKVLKEKLDAAATKLLTGEREAFQYYQFDGDALLTRNAVPKQAADVPPFERVHNLLGYWLKSGDALRAASGKGKPISRSIDSGAPAPFDSADLSNASALQSRIGSEFEKAFNSMPELAEAVKYIGASPR